MNKIRKILLFIPLFFKYYVLDLLREFVINIIYKKIDKEEEEFITRLDLKKDKYLKYKKES